MLHSLFFEAKDELAKNVNTRVLNQVEGNSGCFNDVIVFSRELEDDQQDADAKFNVVFFGGDVQDYEDEMKKSSTCRRFTSWNLMKTGYVLSKKFAQRNHTAANVFIIRPDFFHLKTFANYSNFVTSTDFGVPIDPNKPDEFARKLDEPDENSSSTTPATTTTTATENNNANKPVSTQEEEKIELKDDESSNSSISTRPNNGSCANTSKLRCWQHVHKLLRNAILKYNQMNQEGGEISSSISNGSSSSSGSSSKAAKKKSKNVDLNESLPIVICSFSKGCVVLNQMCSELLELNKLLKSSLTTTTITESGEINDEKESEQREVEDEMKSLVEFHSRVKHLMWLDGGHSGSSNGWIVDERIVATLKHMSIACYVYVTPYQMKGPKTWAIDEYNKFVRLLDETGVTCRKHYYFQEDEDDYEIETHFEILSEFDTNLII